MRGLQCHLAAIYDGSRGHTSPVDWASARWRNGPFSLFKAVYVFVYLSQNKKKSNWSFVFIIFGSNYFQAIQAGVFSKKNASKRFDCNWFFLFLGLLVSCDNSQKKGNEKLSNVTWPQIFDPPKISDHFLVLFAIFFWEFSKAIELRFFQESETIVL